MTVEDSGLPGQDPFLPTVLAFLEKSGALQVSFQSSQQCLRHPCELAWSTSSHNDFIAFTTMNICKSSGH